MPGETTFRTAQPQTSTDSSAGNKQSSNQTVASANAEVPYLDYRKEHGAPLSVEYFGLGDLWNDPVGGFPKEIEAIESYFEDRVSNGDTANSVSAIKDRLKEITKVTGMTKEERNVVRIQIIAEYINFLRKSEDVRRDVTRYGSTR